MPQETVQAKYDVLDQVASRFGKAADTTTAIFKSLESIAARLEAGEWQGDAQKAFSAEFRGEVQPAFNRLTTLFNQAQSTTVEIKKVFQQAEEEAAALFKGSLMGGGSGNGNGSGSGNGSGQAGDGSGQAGNGDKQGSGPTVKGKVKIHTYDYKTKTGETKPQLKLGVSGALLEGKGDLLKVDGPIPYTLKGKYQVGYGEVGIGLGVNGDKKFTIGPYGEATVAKGELTNVYGNKNLAYTETLEGKALSVEGFAGIKDGSLGATVGGTLVSVTGTKGVNVAGVNVGVSAEVGLKAELGFSIGKTTKVKLPFVSFGISFGGAK
ncbi:WXG100 family type VII secretion target [Herpetosiphon llansteffanensis]|uniref:WXG100 family type VII secretion target n=1 Tax=Herpetosiphon llansteffanensis TaxID=2094568 RepID=UPI000D7CFF33|nr:WXG100 family type VII secretion target [Herpetosiphon llansteffanensis]